MRTAWETWKSGGWLMLPLVIFTLFLYYTAIGLYLWVSRHFLVKNRFHELDETTFHRRLSAGDAGLKCLILEDAEGGHEVLGHFKMIRKVYLPPIDRRIRFLSIIVTAGPLLGLLGTVSGMLSTFEGMIHGGGTRFDEVVQGISEALITTQTGLIIAIPAMLMLSIISRKRNAVARAIARLEILNRKLARAAGGEGGHA